jgi:hypothetical protein
MIVLDLSNNILSEDSGRIIGKIMSHHSQRRDDIVWMYSLRGEEAEEDISLKGLCEINLSNNKFNSNTLKDLCYFLQYDGWTRSINLRKNEIGEEGIAEINSILDANESLIRLVS